MREQAACDRCIEKAKAPEFADQASTPAKSERSFCPTDKTPCCLPSTISLNYQNIGNHAPCLWYHPEQYLALVNKRSNVVAEDVTWMVPAGQGATIVDNFLDAAPVGIAGSTQPRVDIGISVAALMR